MNDSVRAGAADSANHDREDSGLRDIMAVADALKQADESGHDFGVALVVKDDEDVLGDIGGGYGTSAAVALVEVDPEPATAEPSVSSPRKRDEAATVTPRAQSATPAAEEKRGGSTWLIGIIVVLVVGGIGFAVWQYQEQQRREADARAARAKPDRTEAPTAKRAKIPEEPEPEDVVEEPEPEPVAEPVGGETGAVEEPVIEDDAVEPTNAGAETSTKARPNKAKEKAEGDAAVDAAAGEGGEAPVEPPVEVPTEAPVEPVEPAPVDAPAEAPKDDQQVDCLLNPDLPKCGNKKKTEETKTEDAGPALPERLDSIALRNGFATVKSKAKACGKDHGAEPGSAVDIHVTIEGATGKVTKVQVKGEHAGTALGKCVEGVVMDATFDKFKRPAMGTDYSVRM
jgi:cytoskeletal protein RodZ